jgi:prepilin signal peptidase PulO-like enzyme (type II secretory pathway)
LNRGIRTLYVIVVLWWLFFWTAVGLCLGSFLNVIIYRIPRDKSLGSPLWSACPNCHTRIRWYDNLPVISFLRLRGRCRDCGAPIATRYVIVELLMALVVLMLLDAFFVGQVRAGLRVTEFGLSDRFAQDWPIFLAHVLLFAALLSMSAIDLEHYWVDVRFTNVATVAGFVLHGLWTPKHADHWLRPTDTTTVVSLFALAGIGLVWVLLACRRRADPEDVEESTVADGLPEEEESGFAPPDSTPLAGPPSRFGGWVLGLIFVAVLVSMFVAETSSGAWAHAPRALVPLVFIFLLIVRQSWVVRESDRRIVELIEEERVSARRMVAGELLFLLPAVAFGVLAWWLMSGEGELAHRMSEVLHTKVRVHRVSMMYRWEPLYGLATAASGYVIAGGIGWAVRIAFTFLFGKEAFGSGDIHLMAAAGCVAGWPVVLLGFMLSCFLALAGWVATLPRKNTRAIPLGPWLSISFLAVVVFYQPIVNCVLVKRVTDAVNLLFYQNSQLS